MQPTLPQTQTGTADMDLTAVQSMDWFFKKEQIYLLAQFWQQRATLAEKEVSTLKEQLSTNTTGATISDDQQISTDLTEDIEHSEFAGAASNIPPNTKLLSPTPANNNNNTKLLNSVAAAITLHQNGGKLLVTTPSPSPPLTEIDNTTATATTTPAAAANSVAAAACLNPKLFFSHAQQMMMEAAAAAAAAAVQQQQQQQQQSPMRSPSSIHTSTPYQATPQLPTAEVIGDDNDLVINHNIAHHHQQQAEDDDVGDDEENDGSCFAMDNKTTTKTAAATNPTTQSASTEAANLITTLTAEFKLNKISDNSISSFHDNDNNNSIASKEQCTEDDDDVNKDANEDSDHVSAPERSCLMDEKCSSTLSLLKNHNNNNDVNSNKNAQSDHDEQLLATAMEQDFNENSTDLSRRANNLARICKNYAEQLAAKEKEIKALFDEVQRLRVLEQTHIVQIHRLEEHLEAKRQHILRLEARLDKQQINEVLTATTNAAATAAEFSTTHSGEPKSSSIATQPATAGISELNENIDEASVKAAVNAGDAEKDNDNVNSAEKSSYLTKDTTISQEHQQSVCEPNDDDQQHNDNDEDVAATAAEYEDDNDDDERDNEVILADKNECGNNSRIDAADNNTYDLNADNVDDDIEEVVEIKKENQSSLNAEQQQTSLDIAAAAAKCANETNNKFQEMLLERSKALSALSAEAETIKNSDAAPIAIETPSNEEVVLAQTADNVANEAKTEFKDDEMPDAEEQHNVEEQLNKTSADEADDQRNATTIDLVDDCQESDVDLVNKNIENFSSLLGEQLVNSYWRHSFNQSSPPLNAASANLLMPPQNQTCFQQQRLENCENSASNSLHQLQKQQQQAYQQQQQAYHQQQQQQLAPSSTALLSQLVNTTFSSQRSTAGSTDILTHHLNASHHFADQHEKSSQGNHDNASTASTPNPHDQRSNDGHNVSLNGSMKSLQHEDNNNRLCVTPTLAMAGHHLPHSFLPGLPFQFQNAQSHFRFADELQLPPGASMAGRLGESLIPKGDPMEAKLQEMLRYNMDKYANQALDTLHISRRVRELLSVHNIGQRLFAKYILGLSQGTVSELLSKPKPWDKLTEKGRDSYRKMHAWACDDNAVMLLKSLIPKKDSGLPQYGSGGRGEDSMSDERIAHILNEASSIMKNVSPGNASFSQQQQQQIKDEQQRLSVHDESQCSNDESKSPHPSCTSPFFKDQLKQQQQGSNDSLQQQQQQQQQQRLRQQDETQDKMARFYQELMARTPREASFPGFLLSPFFGAAGGIPGNLAPQTFPVAAAAMAADENIRLSFEREMAKLQQQHQHAALPNLTNLMALQQQMLNGAQDLTLGKDLKEMSKVNGQRLSHENCSNSMDSQSNSTTSNHNLNNNTKENDASSVNSFHQRKHDSSTPAPPSTPQSASNPLTQNTSNTTAPSPLSNSILPPAMTANDDFSSAASPLQRMASITNSLITQPPVTPHHSQPQRPTKAVLPPITQQQFDMFNNLNTEDIVRRVKEALSQYSISQRLFGESVLGLSQGSVSDLLARPKPWHMLTQKGREPFIRMKMFLEDENAVHKLVASQYKIAPEKLMRTGSYSGSPQIPQGLATKMQTSLPMQKMMSELKLQEPTQAQHIMQQMQAAAMSAAMQQQQQQAQAQSQQQQAAAAVQAAHAAAAAAVAAQQHHNLLLTSPGLPPQHAIQLPAASSGNSSTNSSNINDKKPMLMPIHSPHQPNSMRNMHQHMSPTVYEMAALTQDLDTQIITTKIKEALLANNIGQKIFGEAVLGLSQGSVSELLSKPKPWHMLSIKGREPFIRMQLWLSDANNVERLQVIKNERREASKRRRSIGPNQQDNSSDTSSNDTNDFYTSSPGPGSVGSAVSGAPPNKKQRVLFSEEQKEALRLAFALDPYPNVTTIEFLANELGLATRTITNWFHNHRMRLKQQVPHGPPGTENPIPSRESTNNTPFDAVQFRLLLQQRLLELHKERMGLSGTTIPYPPYFAAAAFLGRSLASLPGAATGNPSETDLLALNQAFKEQMRGLDLTMSSLKRERTDDFDDDLDESHMSSNESIEDGGEIDDKSGEFKETPRSALNKAAAFFARASRRKPSAPQWVNPAGTTTGGMPLNANNLDERLMNGALTEQTDSLGDKNLTASVENEDNEPSANISQSVMEPEVQIKQEHDDDSNQGGSSNAEQQTEKIKVIAEDKLRVRNLSQDESMTATTKVPTGAPWNFATENL